MLVRIFSNGRFPVNNKILQAPCGRFPYFPLRPLPFVKRIKNTLKKGGVVGKNTKSECKDVVVFLLFTGKRP